MSVLSGRRGRLRRSRRLAVALFCALGLLHAGAGVGLAADKAATHIIVIDGVNYAPETLTFKRGDTVVWVNRDPHTVTGKGAFDSHEIAAGTSWKYIPSKSGEYAYTCTLHPNMKGTLGVE